jgi:hypothetical protein
VDFDIFRSPSAGLNRIRFQGVSQSRRNRIRIEPAKADTPGGSPFAEG